MRLITVCLSLGCYATSPPVTRDSSTQINADNRYAHDSGGNVINGPSYIDQRVWGERDASGAVHVATDQWILQRADQLAVTQIQIAQLAAERTHSGEICQLAHRQAEEQRRLDEEIRAQAAQHNVTLLARIAPNDQAAYERIAALDGAELDRAYLDTTRELSRAQLVLWDDARQSTSSRALARFAEDTRPRLESSYATIEQTRM